MRPRSPSKCLAKCPAERLAKHLVEPLSNICVLQNSGQWVVFEDMDKKLKVLLIVEQCNPEGSSVPLVGYNFYKEISQRAEVTLITHGRNQASLKRAHPDSDIVYLYESDWSRRYYIVADRLSRIKGKIIWPLRLTLAYPIYAEFNRQVYQQFAPAIEQGRYDIVHAITPMVPRYPVKVVDACDRTPFVLGPVNGGVPYPDGFKSVGRREFSGLNFLRSVGRFLIPGYQKTYQQADYILAGSSYTAGLIKRLFDLSDERVELFYENGLMPEFVKSLPTAQVSAQTAVPVPDHRPEQSPEQSLKRSSDHLLNLLFVGRLVPYKSADILIESLSKLPADILQRVQLTIVGDGSERDALERQVAALNLGRTVTFTGWVAQTETLQYYRQSDIFCFPSVREFGGAVVLEAMANGLPCIVVNNGGIGEYVTEKTGYKIEPISRSFVVQALAESIEHLATNPSLRQQMADSAVQRANAFTWDVKAERIVEIYKELLRDKITVP